MEQERECCNEGRKKKAKETSNFPFFGTKG